MFDWFSIVVLMWIIKHVSENLIENVLWYSSLKGFNLVYLSICCILFLKPEVKLGLLNISQYQKYDMGYFNCNSILATMWQSLTTRGKALLETMVVTIYGRIAYPPLLGTHILRNETHYMRIPTPDIPVKLTQTMRHVSLYTCFG